MLYMKDIACNMCGLGVIVLYNAYVEVREFDWLKIDV